MPDCCPDEVKAFGQQIKIVRASFCNKQQQQATERNHWLTTSKTVLMSTGIHIPRTCIFCGKVFVAQKTVTKYCSHRCNQRHYKVLKRQEKVQQTLEDDKRAATEPIALPSTKSPGNKEYLSVADACELYGISRFTVYRLIESGKIAAGKMGRRTIIPRSEFTKLFS